MLTDEVLEIVYRNVKATAAFIQCEMQLSYRRGGGRINSNVPCYIVPNVGLFFYITKAQSILLLVHKAAKHP